MGGPDDKYLCIFDYRRVPCSLWLKAENECPKNMIVCFSCVGAFWSNSVASLLFEVGKLPIVNKSMKENRDLYQYIHLKWPHSAKLHICKYSHINVHKHFNLLLESRLLLQNNLCKSFSHLCKSNAPISGEQQIPSLLLPSEVAIANRKCAFHNFVLPAQIYWKTVFQNKTQVHP